MESNTDFQHLEEQLFAQEVRANATALLALLADDFVEFGASGEVWTRAEVIAGLQNEAHVPRFLTDFVARRLASNVVLVTYRCYVQLPMPADTRVSLRSSTWRLNNGRWQMLFHQGTRAADV